FVRLLDESVRRAMAEGLDKDHAATADFAVCAFIDEILLSSTWKGRGEWLRNPLQLARHGTATAGEDFYRILDVLLQQAGEVLPLDLSLAPLMDGQDKGELPPMLRTVLEIFALCLSQGFTGMLFNDRAAIRGKLAAISRFIPTLAQTPAEGQAARLFPEAYPAAPARRNPLNSLRRFDRLDWLLWLAPLLVTAILYHMFNTRLDALLDALTEGLVPR
ncbi:MAG: DotU family type IV/VI secretion system protein, partial [Desulfovibrio sp.]|nr:DotU family type IV/VI secretion system protein [Desulfovibrio sp.]